MPDEHGGVTVLLDGHQQSYVDVDDPEALYFEYVQHLAAVLDATSSGRVAVTHVGGAGLTLPRWVAATRPGSPQVVLEPHAALTETVRAALPLPRGHRIRVRPVAGREGVAALRDGSADAVVVDAFDRGQVPASLQTVDFLRDVVRVLLPGGVVLLNVPDEPGLRHVGRVVAGLREALRVADGEATREGSVAVVATHDVLKGRRYGNHVLVGSRRPLDLDEIRRQLTRWPFPSGVLGGAALARRVAGARPITDAEATSGEGAGLSPRPPSPGSWRVR